MPRLFLALEIPRTTAMSLSLLRGGVPGARWIDVDNYHITLRFIGDIPGRTADELVDHLDRIDRRSFQLSLNSVGLFGSKKPHSIWAGVQHSTELFELHGELERLCQRMGLAPDPRKFSPHVTLARLRHAKVQDVARYMEGRGDFRTSPFDVTRFVLMSSRDSVGGGPYLREEAFALSGGDGLSSLPEWRDGSSAGGLYDGLHPRQI